MEHHVDSVFEFGVLEAVRQGEALVPDRFPHQKKLILGSIDAMIEDGVIGLVLVQELEFAEGDPDEGIEPMDQRDRRKQQDIQGMGLADMGLLVEADDRIRFRVLPAHDDGPAPAERGDVGLGQYEPGTILQAHGGAFPDGPIHPDHRRGGPAQHG